MATIESFRICLLAKNHALPAERLAQRQSNYEGALRRLLSPLELGRRLSFVTADTDNGLWQIASITSSGQTPIDPDNPMLTYLDPELHREATTAGTIVFEAFEKLNQLIQQNSFTPASIENFCTEHFGKLEAEQLKPLLRASMRAMESIQVVTSTGDFSLFNLETAPRLITDEMPVNVRLRVLDISHTSATVKPNKLSARQLGIKVRRVKLEFEVGLTVDSSVGRKLLKALQRRSSISCVVHRIAKVSGDFYGLLLPRNYAD